MGPRPRALAIYPDCGRALSLFPLGTPPPLTWMAFKHGGDAICLRPCASSAGFSMTGSIHAHDMPWPRDVALSRQQKRQAIGLNFGGVPPLPLTNISYSVLPYQPVVRAAVPYSAHHQLLVVRLGPFGGMALAPCPDPWPCFQWLLRSTHQETVSVAVMGKVGPSLECGAVRIN
ncbi:hypothetical protein LY76DRAFT_339815 [Colletotrichum caudatum]|nr:hypothetical protein LY76DRAFT_339815 [Colletotrichum caudatum]